MGMFLKRARKGFEGGIMVKVGGIGFGVPQHASLFSPIAVADIPSPTSSVPIFSLISLLTPLLLAMILTSKGRRQDPLNCTLNKIVGHVLEEALAAIHAWEARF